MWNDNFEHVLFNILGHGCVWITNFKCWQKAYVELRKFEMLRYANLSMLIYANLRMLSYANLGTELRNEHITEFCMYQMQDMERRPAYCMSV